MTNREKYVFVSYSSKNQQMADSVRLMLIEKSIPCWMAPYDIPAGSKYAFVINDALENCSCLVLLLTNASQESQFVEREIERAITYKKPIIPMQLEDLQLNSGFKFYIGNSQIIAVPELRADSSEFNRVIDGIYQFIKNDNASIKQSDHTTMIPTIKQKCEITIFSPVNVEVFINDKIHPLMKIDRNNGFDYQRNTAIVANEFVLIFVAKGFEKAIQFEVPNDHRIEYRLNAVLSSCEIESSYDRNDSLRQLSIKPTGYAFEQLSLVGREEDIQVISNHLKSLAKKMTVSDSHNNYLIARAIDALGNLSIKYHTYEELGNIIRVYKDYPAKKSYGYIIEKVISELQKALTYDFELQNHDLLTQANQEDAEAQYQLGLKYADKESPFKNHKKAFHWFLKAAENGNVTAMLRVATLYYTGLGCGGKNTAKEQYWYRRAMDAGSEKAIICLAEALDHGYFDHGKIGKNEQEKAEAILLYKKAAELGYSKASKALAFKYMTEKDYQNAVIWLRKAAEQGDAECQLYYAKNLFYENEESDPLSHQEEAYEWYKKAAEQGNRLAQYAVARSLFYGIGVKKNETTSFEWCHKAAKQGLQCAQVTLSIMYGRGLGINLDDVKSEYWYRMAYDLNSAERYKKRFLEHLKLLTDSFPVFSDDFEW